ncbi:MAG: hypothetical protein E6G35_14550 [Actinobacteria bacterium]|nr:MAG: hypothetical protein E6G35_14550 [Actinomycetota bacterium]
MASKKVISRPDGSTPTACATLTTAPDAAWSNGVNGVSSALYPIRSPLTSTDAGSCRCIDTESRR